MGKTDLEAFVFQNKLKPFNRESGKEDDIFNYDLNKITLDQILFIDEFIEIAPLFRNTAPDIKKIINTQATGSLSANTNIPTYNIMLKIEISMAKKDETNYSHYFDKFDEYYNTKCIKLMRDTMELINHNRDPFELNTAIIIQDIRINFKVTGKKSKVKGKPRI